MGNEHQEQSTIADDSTVANGSMVFDFVEGNDLSVGSESNEDNVNDLTTSSRDASDLSVASDYSNFEGELVDKSMVKLQKQVLGVRESGVYDTQDK